MRRFIISFFSIIILYLLQCTLFAGPLKMGLASPNLILMFACIVGFMRGRKSGLLTGFFGGLLIDIMNGNLLGFTSLMFMYAGFFNGMFYKEYTKEQMLLPIGLVALSDISYGMLFYITKFMMRSRLSIGFYISRVIFPEMIYTVVVTIFAYILVYYINRELDLIGKKRHAKNVHKELT